MAQNANVVSLDFSDEENNSPKPAMKQCMESDSSDSDTSVPKIKKKRATKTAVMSEYVPDLNQPSQLFGGSKSIFHSNVYSTCISQQSKPSLLIPTASIISEEDDDNDVDDDLFKKKPKQRSRNNSRQKKVSTAKPSRKSTRTSPRKKNKKPTCSSDEDEDDDLEDYKPQVIMIEDEETDVDSDEDVRPNSSSLSLSQAREPTPPPDSPENVLPTRSKRMKKQVKTAFKKLEKARQIHNVITQDMMQDADLSLVEVISPSKNDQKEISVKVKSRSGIQRFPMKRCDSFVQIFQEIATHEFVSENQLTMFLNDRRINLYDTPAILGLEIADIIECYIRTPEEVAADVDDSLLDDPNKIVLRVQTKDAKSRLNITIGLEEPLEKLMREFCQKQNLCYDDVTFNFDGEDIYSYQTPSVLDLEDGYCIDVIKL